MSNLDQWCFAWPEPRSATNGGDRQGMLRAAQWPAGGIISVSFLDGTPELQQRVRDTALTWVGPNMANLTLDFRKTTDTDIRISFTPGGSWSTIGTTCRQVTDRNQPTMNFGWLTDESTDDALRRVVLHEFGHALGMVHEHQIPENGIQWDREAVLADLYPRWDEEKIEQNIFEPVTAKESNYWALDPTSIMMYPIPERWTRNGFSTGLNSNLSERDREFIREMYPPF